MDAIDFLKKYQRLLNTRIEELSLSVTSGSAVSYEDYKARVGEIQGVAVALDELKSLLQKANYDEDSLST
jgi:hypothetical protein